MKHIFVFNPTAGKKSGIDSIKAELQEKAIDLDYELYQTKGVGDACNYVRTWCESNPTDQVRFYACGGDGTLNEVVNGMALYSQASVTSYPCGSGNDFVKYYGGAEKFLNISELIQGTTKPVDLIKVNGKYCVNICNFGFDTTVLKTMIKFRHNPIFWGKRAYFAGVISAVINAMKTQCIVSVDGTRLNNKEMLLCTIANGQYVGGSFKCAPYSLNDDGLLDVCLVHRMSRIKLVTLIKSYAKGQHLDDERFQKYIAFSKGKRIEISAKDNILLSLDGELIQGKKFTVEIVPKAINFAVPK